MEELRAFYEGNIVNMSKFQGDYFDSKKEVHWYDWDMVMILPNPDYRARDENTIEDVDEAVKRYKQ